MFELLVSISIIGILVALATVSYSAAQKKARDARRIQDMKSIQTAAEQYYSINNYSYPLVGLYTAGTAWAVGSQSVLESFPSDPKPSPQPAYTATNISTSTYCVCATMEGTAQGNSLAGCNFTGGTTHFCVKNQQ